MANDWVVKEIVEPKTGKAQRLYFYKGKICKRIVLESPIAKQLAGYVLIEKDLRSAGVWLAEIDKLRGLDVLLDPNGSRQSTDRDRYNLVKGLFVAALTFYGKCFAQCEGRRVKLERRQISPEFQEVHDDAISFRNNFAAHSGAKLLESASIALVLPPKYKKNNPPKIYREMTQPDFAFSDVAEKSLSKLVEHVRSVPLQKIDQLTQKIMQDEVLPNSYEYWSKI